MTTAPYSPSYFSSTLPQGEQPGCVVEYRQPYGRCELAWQVFPGQPDRAASMAAFYRSCGSPARVI